MKVLRLLRERCIKSQHSGSYLDPSLGKPRQIDIRAEVSEGPHTARLAIECKNLSPANPLLLLRTARTAAESYVDLRFVSSTTLNQQVIRKRANECPYGALDFVGRSFDQVSKWVDRKKQRSTDSAVGACAEMRGAESDPVFQKMTQCLASAVDLISGAFGPYQDVHGWLTVRSILVVPDRCLWVCDYDQDGELQSEPRHADLGEVFVGMKYFVEGHGLDFSISHVDVMTLGGLSKWTAEHFVNDESMRALIVPLGG